jgi:hypothetical protein
MVASPTAARAASRLYDAECAFHTARMTGIDSWIAAAADRLHAAIVAYRDAVVSKPPR